MSSAALVQRITELLQADPVCDGRVAQATIVALAGVVSEQPARVDDDVRAERKACLVEMARILDRLRAINIDDQDDIALVGGDDFLLELRRFDEAMEGIRIGLHRVDDQPFTAVIVAGPPATSMAELAAEIGVGPGDFNEELPNSTEVNNGV